MLLDDVCVLGSFSNFCIHMFFRCNFLLDGGFVLHPVFYWYNSCCDGRNFPASWFYDGLWMDHLLKTQKLGSVEWSVWVCWDAVMTITMLSYQRMAKRVNVKRKSNYRLKKVSALFRVSGFLSSFFYSVFPRHLFALWKDQRERSVSDIYWK